MRLFWKIKLLIINNQLLLLSLRSSPSNDERIIFFIKTIHNDMIVGSFSFKEMLEVLKR